VADRNYIHALEINAFEAIKSPFAIVSFLSQLSHYTPTHPSAQGLSIGKAPLLTLLTLLPHSHPSPPPSSWMLDMKIRIERRRSSVLLASLSMPTLHDYRCSAAGPGAARFTAESKEEQESDAARIRNEETRVGARCDACPFEEINICLRPTCIHSPLGTCQKSRRPR